MNKIFSDAFKNFLLRYECLKKQIHNIDEYKAGYENSKLYKDFYKLKKNLVIFSKYKSVVKEILELKLLLNKKNNDIKELIIKELNILYKKKDIYEANIKEILSLANNKINFIEDNVFIELRAATGGSESAIFVEDLLKMYIGFLTNRKWKKEIISYSYGKVGGYKDIVLKITGNNTFKVLQHESGIHRVQRVPKTEVRGRVHTSTCSVAVLPETNVNNNIKINICDLKIDTYRASGAGGQHVNVTDSAVRITHIPTGLVSECQNERSQHKNKSKALALLKVRILLKKKEKEKNKIDNQRRIQVGSGARSEKIRTYNFKEFNPKAIS